MSLQRVGSWLIVCGLCVAQAAHAARLTVTIEGIQSLDGVVMVGLFNTSAGFPNKPLAGQSTTALMPSVVLIFENVEPGRYALSAYHDRNNNGKLDVGAFGIPKEPFGFSRDARGKMGPPTFDDAAFEVPAVGISLVIHFDVLSR